MVKHLTSISATSTLRYFYFFFKMEGAHIVRGLLQPRDWCTKVDIADAYPHILILPSFGTSSASCGTDRFFALSPCFGVSSTPRLSMRHILDDLLLFILHHERLRRPHTDGARPFAVPWLDGKAIQGRGSANLANRVLRHDDRYSAHALHCTQAQG